MYRIVNKIDKFLTNSICKQKHKSANTKKYLSTNTYIMNKYNVLLFGGGLQMISSARSLKEVGYRVVAATKHDKIASKSRYINKHINIENDSEPELVINNLISIVKEEQIDVIIPMEDAQAACLSKCKKELMEKTSIKCAVMDWDVFSMVSDKTQLLAFCKKYGIGHPKTRLISDNYNEIANDVGFPALIKPNHSEGAKGIVLANNIEELKDKAPKIIAEYGECALQEYIASKSYYYNLMLYRNADGKFGNSVIIKILRYYPIKGGSSSLCVSVENEIMTEMCKTLLNKLNWVGFADFDILEKGDGDYKIIEINPRVPASLRGAAISGVNYLEMIVTDLMEGTLKIYDYHTGKYLRYLGLDIAWFMASPHRWSCKPCWFKFFDKNLHYQEGGLHDIPAMWTSMVEGVKKQLNPSFRKAKSGMN